MIYNKLSKKWKLGLGIGLVSFGGAFTLTAGLMTIPGMGLESQKFINSVEAQIDRILPKGKYVLDKTSMAYSMVVQNSLKASFLADALSTFDFASDDENQTMQKAYKDFVDNWWSANWAEKTEFEKEDIDLNDIGKNMIEFDKAVATKFHSYGYVHTGFSWMFSKGGFNDIFSSEMKTQAIGQQTIWDQATYESTLAWQPTGLSEFKVTSSNGGNIVNNKVWLLNQQIEGLKLLVSLGNLDLGGIAGFSQQERALDFDLNVLKDKNLTAESIASKVTVDDLYQPNFTSAINTQRAAIVMLFMAIVILPATISLGTLAILEAKKG